MQRISDIFKSDIRMYMFVDIESALKYNLLKNSDVVNGNVSENSLFEDVNQMDIMIPDIKIPFFLIITDDTYENIKEAFKMSLRTFHIFGCKYYHEKPDNVTIHYADSIEDIMATYDIDFEHYNVQRMENSFGS